jgi:DNA-binding transcriptional ArsR family regulator
VGMPEKINNPSMKGVLAQALDSFGVTGAASMHEGVLTMVADHVRAALEGSPTITLENVECEIRDFFQKALAAAPPAARAGVRGSGDSATAAAFLLGQIAFAHLLAARTLDTRVDAGFSAALEDKRYLPYLRAMLSGAKDGVTLARMAAEAVETVSRKLAVLRERGLVVSHQQGTRGVNKLTPAAKAMLLDRGVHPLVDAGGKGETMDAVIAELAEEAPPHLRKLPVIGDGKPRKAA